MPSTLPRIISVDDHVVEPPTLWSDRLPSKLRERGPRVERDRAELRFKGGVLSYEKGGADGAWCDWWVYDDLLTPFLKVAAAAGMENLDVVPTTYDAIRPGCWKQADRLQDMDANHVDASLCFPNILPRFAGQTFAERPDKELALLCVKAYNDWMIEDWCGGAGAGRLIPLAILPLWDPQLAADEVRRCASLGSFAVAFSENPHPLGLPSIHSGAWDRLFEACQESETVVCMHIGSSSKMPSTSPDAPWIVSSTLTFANAMGSLLDFIFSGTLERFPRLRVAYSEGQVGWIPYVMERADKLWKERPDNDFGSGLLEPPSSFMPQVFGCIFDDEVGLLNRHLVGMSQICFETDYPHADSTFPDSAKIAEEICARAGLSEEEIYKLLRGNAIRAFGLHRFGIEM
jgi:predicted TIM-barrel fold metal-dependent hydrolase